MALVADFEDGRYTIVAVHYDNAIEKIRLPKTTGRQDAIQVADKYYKDNDFVQRVDLQFSGSVYRVID